MCFTAMLIIIRGINVFMFLLDVFIFLGMLFFMNDRFLFLFLLLLLSVRPPVVHCFILLLCLYVFHHSFPSNQHRFLLPAHPHIQLYCRISLLLRIPHILSLLYPLNLVLPCQPHPPAHCLQPWDTLIRLHLRRLNPKTFAGCLRSSGTRILIPCLKL